MPDGPTHAERTQRLADARLMLIFVPELCTGSSGLDAEATLAALLPEVDVLQIRPKSLGQVAARSDAHSTREWSRKALELRRELEGPGPLLIVNDRVDVAALLGPEGLDGVHIGQDDLPAAEARRELGPDALIGLSTHAPAEVVEAGELPVDYLGFGPAFPTTTKGYDQAQGTQRVWIASNATDLPVFAIGGIDAVNVTELDPVRRVAVGAAVLQAEDPVATARQLRRLLS